MAGTKLDEAAVFNAARRIDDPAERRRYVGEACGEDRALASRVEALLRMHDEGPTFLPCPAEEVRDLLGASDAEGPGTQIGPYKLLRPIGEGGMGTVFLAEQSEPLQRQVAIKVIRPGKDSRQVLARFEQERQALALMDHPHIAKVLDAGETPPAYAGGSPRPYFVMERIDGVSITAYCDRACLSVRERLALFVPVCQAVQHAHQKGIIHRDLKPSNVLVTLYDGKAVPKVIDFGIAKATGQKLTERALETQVGSVVGTLEYMSPEQAEPGQPDVDTRSDIYSLGVLLYELLTGTTPLGPTRREGAALLDLLRAVREEEPTRPSTRLDTTEELPVIAAKRGVEPKKLRALVQGDLDWIVLKCLEKDRDRRYESASALALDVEHYLNDAPVAACPPSRGYRLRKFVRRNRGAVLAASTIALLLVLGIVGTTTGLVRAERARQDAESSQQHEETQRRLAETRDAETRAVLGFVERRILAAARPKGYGGGLGPDVTVRKALEAALPFVEKSFTDRPLIEARLRMTLGDTFFDLHEARVAAEQYEAARAIYTKLLGVTHRDTLRSMAFLADSYDLMGKGDAAAKLHQETLDLRKANLGPDDPETLASMNNLGMSYFTLERYADAIRLYEETLALQKVRFGPQHRATLATMTNLANCYGRLDRHLKALELREKTAALLKAKFGPDNYDTLMGMNNLAASYRKLERYEDARLLDEETLERRKKVLTPDHPDTLSSMWGLAKDLINLGRGADALPVLDDCLRRSVGKRVHRNFPEVADLRLRLFEKAKDVGGCRTTAELWEKQQRTDAHSLYKAAVCRAVTAAVLRATDTSPTAAKEAAAEANRAMAWLRQAVKEGYKDVAFIKKDTDLDALRDRADFQELLGQLQARSSKDRK
ncbi:MAG TPA: serine/threonine-protein kinase [Gemmataceae bacterium]|jgi:serine/threonine protein kinase|nr:serine/threonine-protein kinase [Gemmataceae bacterium]